jgi:GNAT superfamily N-acetyltransferase
VTDNQIPSVTVTQVDVAQASTVMGLVEQLLRELGEEGDETGPLDGTALANVWRAREDQHFAFLARVGDSPAVGVVTVVETFAVYAGGPYGVINEMYVAPGYRSSGVGACLIEAVKALGRAKGWKRVDVTAPESARWARTQRFYERLGFTFTGPKLKLLLK